MVAKRTIIIKDTRTGGGSPFVGSPMPSLTLSGRVIPAGGQRDFSGFSAQRFRVNDAVFTPLIEAGDITINDGSNDLSAAAAKDYLYNDIGTDALLPGKYIVIPVGTTADRPGSPLEGTMFRNTDIDAFEFFIAGVWQPVGLFGAYYTYVSDMTVSTTTSTTFQTKLTLTTPVIPPGQYRIKFNYGWNYDSTFDFGGTTDFEGKCLEDNVQIGEIHKQKPQSAGTDDVTGDFSTTGSAQKHYKERLFIRTISGPTTTHTYTLQWRTRSLGTEASVWDVSIEFWRVG